jgi:hypothetical protein
MEAVTVVTGKSTSAPYMSFGDDSQYEGRLVYAYVFFKRTKLKSILREISLLKKRFKFPKGVDLHCRNLISGQQRKKLGLSHLSKTDVESIFRNIITIINKYKVLVRYSHASEDVKGYFDRGIEVGSNDPNMPNFMLNTRYDPKGVLGLLATMCFAINPDGSEGPIADQCEIYTSPDYTKVDFWGGVKQQAHYLTGGFSAIGAADNEIYKIESNIGGAVSGASTASGCRCLFVLSCCAWKSSRTFLLRVAFKNKMESGTSFCASGRSAEQWKTCSCRALASYF